MRLQIEKAIYGGNGLARLPAEQGSRAGKAVFVPYALPGETVEATLNEDHGGYATARVEAILEPSASRTQPGCPYFGVCGGCQYQHAEYSFQLEMKIAVLRETLTRAGIREAPEIQSLQSQEYGYRNRIRVHVDLRGVPSIGYHVRSSRELLDIRECPIAAPMLQRSLMALRQTAKAGMLPRSTTQAEVFCNPRNQVLLSLFCARDAGETALDALAAFLREIEPGIAGVSSFLSENDRRPARAMSAVGATALEYGVGGQSLRVSAASFFQTNRFLVEPLQQLVTGDRSGALAWDLYAGVGLFAGALASQFERVIAVETAPASVADLAQNLQGNTRTVRATTLEFLRRELNAATANPPDLIVVDPPRSGLGKEVTSLLAKINARELVYISCDPATLARDLRPLLDCGYTARNMHLVDLFPQTFHLETVTVLDRRA